MLREAINDAEQAYAHHRLVRARDLMLEAINLLDGTPVATDCDGHLDLALHNLADAIADVKAGAPIFTTLSQGSGPIVAEAFGQRRNGGTLGSPWDPASPA